MNFLKKNAYFLAADFVLALTGDESSVWDLPNCFKSDPFIGFVFDFMMVGATKTEPADTRCNLDCMAAFPGLIFDLPAYIQKQKDY